MANTKGQARQTRLLAIACGTPPSVHERDSDGFTIDRFSEYSDRSFSDRFKGVRDGIGNAASEIKVVKLKFAQPIDCQAVERRSVDAARSQAALDAAWPDTLLFAVAIGNLATSDVLPFAQRLNLPGPQQHELSARLRGGEPILPSRRTQLVLDEELDLLQSLDVWSSAGCKRPFCVLAAKPTTCTDADRHSDLMESVRNAASGLAAAKAAATAAPVLERRPGWCYRAPRTCSWTRGCAAVTHAASWRRSLASKAVGTRPLSSPRRTAPPGARDTPPPGLLARERRDRDERLDLESARYAR